MKKVIVLFFVAIVAIASAQEAAQQVTSESTATSIATDRPSTELVGDIQEAIGGDMDLKMMIVEDGSAGEKCFCSCNLNNQPVFMEINSSDLDSYAVV